MPADARFPAAAFLVEESRRLPSNGDKIEKSLTFRVTLPV